METIITHFLTLLSGGVLVGLFNYLIQRNKGKSIERMTLTESQTKELGEVRKELRDRVHELEKDVANVSRERDECNKRYNLLMQRYLDLKTTYLMLLSKVEKITGSGK